MSGNERVISETSFFHFSDGMLKKIARWRFFIVILLTGSLLWFISNSTNQKSQQVEEKEELNYDTINQVHHDREGDVTKDVKNKCIIYSVNIDPPPTVMVISKENS